MINKAYSTLGHAIEGFLSQKHLRRLNFLDILMQNNIVQNIKWMCYDKRNPNDSQKIRMRVSLESATRLNL